MINFALGVAVGAAFAPFWLALWKKFQKTEVYKKTIGSF